MNYERKYRDQIGPIHYDTDLFKSFLDTLKEHSTPEEYTIKMEWNNRDTRMSFDDAYDVLDSQNMPNRIYSYTIILRAEEGYIRVDGDGNREYHRLIVKGDADWVKMNIQNIESFVEEQGDFLGKWINNSNLFLLQAIISIGIISHLSSPIFTLFLDWAHFPFTTEQLYFLVGNLFLIGLLEIPKRTYPYVVILRNDSDALYQTVISIVVVILSVVGGGLSILDALPI